MVLRECCSCLKRGEVETEETEKERRERIKKGRRETERRERRGEEMQGRWRERRWREGVESGQLQSATNVFRPGTPKAVSY